MGIINNIMKANWRMIFSLVALWIIPPDVTFADHDEPWFTEQLKTSGILLSPGAKTFCNKNFMVENMSQESAEVQVTLGNEDDHYIDTLDPNEKLAYFQSPFETGDAGSMRVADARIVNTGFEAVKVHCK